jgi:hypothetical protein
VEKWETECQLNWQPVCKTVNWLYNFSNAQQFFGTNFAL